MRSFLKRRRRRRTSRKRLPLATMCSLVPTTRHASPTRCPPPDDDSTEVLKQPDTRAISQEQLVAEVKGIYAGLVMVQSKCIE
ncbi:hypothetical protein C8A05DRAFT_38878, partial [Staphylotrichum tortipilum]